MIVTAQVAYPRIFLPRAPRAHPPVEEISRITLIFLVNQTSRIRAIRARLGGAFRLRGSAKCRYGATTVGEARVISGE